MEIKQLKVKLECEGEKVNESSQFEIDLLSNDVENILIEQAFKIQKFKDFCSKNQMYGNMNQMHPYQVYQQQQQNYFNYQQPYYGNYGDMEIGQGRRNLGLSNLVETRKTQSRLGNKY